MHSIAQEFIGGSFDEARVEEWLSAARYGTRISFDPNPIRETLADALGSGIDSGRLSRAVASWVADRVGSDLPEHIAFPTRQLFTIHQCIAWIAFGTVAAVRRCDPALRGRLREWRKVGAGFQLQHCCDEISLFDLRLYEAEYISMGKVPKMSVDAAVTVALARLDQCLMDSSNPSSNAVLAALACGRASIGEFKVEPSALAEKLFQGEWVMKKFPHRKPRRAAGSEAKALRYLVRKMEGFRGEPSETLRRAAVIQEVRERFGLSAAHALRMRKTAIEISGAHDLQAPGRPSKSSGPKSKRSKSTRN